MFCHERRRLTVADLARDHAWQVGEREDPRHPHGHHREGDQKSVADQGAGVEAADRLDHGRQLQTDEYEQRRVEQEGDDLPHGEVLYPRRRRSQPRGQPAHVDADGDRGEHARDADRLGGQVGEVGAEERDRDLDRWVVQAAANPRDHCSEGDADADAADDRDDEVEARVDDAEAAGDDSGNRELVGDEGGAVVDQALALDDRDDAPGNAKAPSDRRRGDGIGRGDDRAENERFGPAEVECGMSHHRDDAHRRQHQADRQQADLADVAAQLAQWGEERRRVQQWRQQDQQDELRIELDVGDVGDRGEAESTEHHQQRVRDTDQLSGDQQRDDGGENDEQGEVGVHLA